MVVSSYTLLDMLGVPAVRPLARVFLKTGPIAWTKRLSQRLPAYGALVMLAVPFIVAEPAKVYGLFLIGKGHLAWGIITIIAAYLVSLLLVDTIYDGARPQLRSIKWFAGLVDWASAIRGSVTSAVLASRPVLFAAGILARMRA